MRTTTMTMLPRLLAGVLMAAALGVGGCSIEPGAPDMPTFEAAVLPIFQSRCVRCHGDPLGSDPTADLLPPSNPYYKISPSYLRMPPLVKARFDKFEDTGCDAVDGATPDSCFRGAQFFAPYFAAYVGDNPMLPMPPPPAPPLTKHQQETILRWVAESPPLER